MDTLVDITPKPVRSWSHGTTKHDENPINVLDKALPSSYSQAHLKGGIFVSIKSKNHEVMR